MRGAHKEGRGLPGVVKGRNFPLSTSKNRRMEEARDPRRLDSGKQGGVLYLRPGDVVNGAFSVPACPNPRRRVREALRGRI
jgi:hypothetical protein